MMPAYTCDAARIESVPIHVRILTDDDEREFRHRQLDDLRAKYDWALNV
jgi:hypothetical protein